MFSQEKTKISQKKESYLPKIQRKKKHFLSPCSDDTIRIDSKHKPTLSYLTYRPLNNQEKKPGIRFEYLPNVANKKSKGGVGEVKENR